MTSRTSDRENRWQRGPPYGEAIRLQGPEAQRNLGEKLKGLGALDESGPMKVPAVGTVRGKKGHQTMPGKHESWAAAEGEKGLAKDRNPHEDRGSRKGDKANNSREKS